MRAELSVDLNKIRAGDSVTLCGTVREIHASMLTVQVGRFEDHQAVYVYAKEIIGHTPRPLAVGDRVWGLATKCDGKVLYVIGDLAWVEFEDGRHEIVLPHQVERS